ncbi:30S ribosomal protein S17 [Candidatus Woesearchaeota archaeon]|nr:30S ribosomal protein S17 [Candidatus Woesearchaeota archaeon]
MKPAKNSDCKDERCPFHGKLKIHGRAFTVKVTSVKMRRTATVELERRHYIKKYSRYERRITRLKAHNPDCIAAAEGDTVKVVECRPISKTKKFVIIEKVKQDAGSESKGN